MGTPDIVHQGRKVAVFIDGCFWHGCPKCYTAPATNQGFWSRKLISNRLRRRKVLAGLKRDGWCILQFWQCEIRRNVEKVADRIARAIRNRVGAGARAQG
jgi:DNA mismatch endonuclease (patch repair protein)